MVAIQKNILSARSYYGPQTPAVHQAHWYIVIRTPPAAGRSANREQRHELGHDYPSALVVLLQGHGAIAISSCDIHIFHREISDSRHNNQGVYLPKTTIDNPPVC